MSSTTSWEDATCQVAGFVWLEPEAFAFLPDHPAQRDTKLHVIDLLRADALERPNIRHAHVACVMIASEEYPVQRLGAMFDADQRRTLASHACKLDGHTRSAIWSDTTIATELGVPSQVRCEVFIARDLEAATRLYTSFDNAAAMKGQADTLQSTFRIAEIGAVSHFVRSATFRKSLDVALALQAGGIGRIEQRIAAQQLPKTERKLGDFDLHEILPYLRTVEWFKDAIKLLDGLDVKPQRTPPKLPVSPPYVAAYLAILRRDPEKGLEFLTTLCSSQGNLVDETMDAVYAITHFDAELQRLYQKMPATRRTAVFKEKSVVPLVLNAYTAWLKGDDGWAAGQFPYRGTAVLSSFDPCLLDRGEPPPRTRRSRRKAQEEAGQAAII